MKNLNSDGMVTLIEWTTKEELKECMKRNRKEAKGTTKGNMVGRITRSDKKERGSMERG
jgi:hypothetical protein